MHKKEARRSYRLPPCPEYDIEGMESWLSDMAADGLHLSRDGFFAGFAIFEKGEPCVTRYRLDAAPKKAGFFADNAGPDADTVSLSASYGWEYVTAYGQFLFYRTSDPNAPELHTDPQVQAIAINQIRRRERGSVAANILWLVWPLIFLKGAWIVAMMDIGTWFVLSALALLFWSCASAVARAVHFRRLRHRLLRGATLDHHKKWRRRAARHRIASLLAVVCSVAWIIALLCLWVQNTEGAGAIPLETYTGNPPFATIADLAPGGTYKLDDFGLSNTVEIRSDWLAPTVIHWAEIATVALPDGKTVSGGLYVDYYETVSSWAAREAAREYLHVARRSRNYEELELPALDIEYAVGYYDSLQSPTLLLQSGNRFMKVTFYQTSTNYQISLADWASIMAASIR